MMIFVTRVFFSGGKQSNSIEAFDQETQAKKRWHSIIAADIHCRRHRQGRRSV